MVIKNKSQRGVTLIELIVVIAIFGLVSSVLLFNYSDFSTNVSVRNLAQDMALSIRKAQTYATSVRAISATDNTITTDRYSGYGMSFSLGEKKRVATDNSINTDPSEKSFILFADVPTSGSTYGNGLYETNGECGNPLSGSECIEVFTISSADRITKLCTDNLCTTTGTINILFRRPSPEAEICISRGGLMCDTQKPSFIRITVESAKGIKKDVTVWNTGQIGVQ